MQGVPRVRRTTRRVIAATAVAVVGLAALGVAMAIADPTPNVYTGCLAKQGTISNVKIGAVPLSTCSGTQTQISWNQVGQPGPQGIQGEQGVQGEPGAQGPPGVLRFYDRQGVVTVPPGDVVQADARCDAGDIAISGGFSTSAGTQLQVIISARFSSTLWGVQFENPASALQSEFGAALVVCADMTP